LLFGLQYKCKPLEFVWARLFLYNDRTEQEECIVTALLGFSRLIDALNDKIGRAAAWIVFATVVLSAFGAIVRYADKYVGTSFSRNEYNEGQWYLYAIGFLLMGAYTLKVGGHVRVDILSSRLSKRTQHWIEAILSLLFIFFVYSVVAFISWDFIYRSVSTFEMSSDAGGLPRWLIKPFMTIGMVLMALQGLSEAIKSFAKIFSPDQDKQDGEDALKGAV
jgi:TRAP-type mannitol/chloroaromatic compound transport system permease small subunit